MTMRALTICQPYAELIARGIKRVENRFWETRYRGPLLIHAGKSKKFLHGDNYGIPPAEMNWGAVVAIADVEACYHIAEILEGPLPASHEFLRTHEHCEGPYCFVLGNIRRFKNPVPYKGAQGFFFIPKELIEIGMPKAD